MCVRVRELLFNGPKQFFHGMMHEPQLGSRRKPRLLQPSP